ncbi:hypothetical protein P3X46_002856 [Hevea brasiliensis]|uniref:C2H2-type domain-containing protein n=1 Tax=Hevea brasiliensis TaxID=3981 RepID=A0ABQ9N4C0_HEVBR|nr:uncharacterized protein LOC110635330 [Hevea brasiliensis]KAJ9187399.1 hypothetical protein P3X46_002856 [Hevea brasiliensis]
MEANPKKKLFICKFCNKRYPCGKSLGGHIRIHLNGNGNSIDIEEDDVKLNSIKSFAAVDGSNSKRDSEPEAGAQSGYGLRENPKKTRRFLLDSKNSSFLQEKVCKECGKGFQSLKALCGHMACHSKNSFEDHSEPTEKLKDQVMDSQSDTETSTPSKRKRSKRMRYKTIGVYSSSIFLANGSMSSASDIEQEQEEVAMCLMMLSKDSGFKGCFSSIADSSDNNSAVLETKSSSPKMKISVKNGVSCVYDDDRILEMKKAKQQEMLSIENDHSDNSDSGYFRNGPKRVESDISVHRFTGNDEFKKHKVEFESRFGEDFDPELGKRLSRFRRIKMELRKDLTEEDRYDEADRAPLKYDSRKRGKNESYHTEFLSSNASKTAGGHRTNHKKTTICSDRVYGSGENSIDSNCVPNPLPSGSISSKKIKSCSGKNPIKHNLSGSSEKKLGFRKVKVHECPFCFKVFRSGQALGGHKRSHFVGGAEDRTVVINQEVPKISMPGLIDLNLPAPMEEDSNGYYIPTW